MVVVACSVGPHATEREPVRRSGQARARRLRASEIVREHEGQRARPGDVVLENERVRFVITGDGGGDGYVGRAGRILDAELMERSTGLPVYDGIDEIVPQVNGCPVDALEVEITRDGRDGDGAEVVARGREVLIPEVLALLQSRPSAHGLALELRYTLADDARELRIETRVRNPNSAPVAVQIGDFALLGSDEAQAFTRPTGFDLQRELSAPTTLGATHQTLPWAATLSAEHGPLRLIEDASVARMVGDGDTGLWQYIVADESLAPGEQMRAVRYLALGRDIAEAGLPQLRREEAALFEIRGQVRAGNTGVEGARVSFFGAGDGFVAQAISDAAGHFEAQLPAGGYRAVATGHGPGEHVVVPGHPRHLAEGHVAGEAVAFELGAEPAEALQLELGAAATLVLHVRDPRRAAVAARIALFPGEAPAPHIAEGERNPLPGSGISDLIWTLDGEATAAVRPGSYTVVASAGPRDSIDVRHDVVLTAGERTTLDLQVERMVPALGYVALDSHQHAMDSQHGEATRAERVITNLAEGLDAVVSSDHDRIVDYGPVLRALGVSRRMVAIPSAELSTTDAGHHNIWPLHFDPDARNGGALEWWLGGTLDTFYDRSAELGGVVFQLNHGASYFERAGFDLGTASAEASDTFSFRFNAMEIQNGLPARSRAQLTPIWYALLNAGRRIAPLGVSDSHARSAAPGQARSYVYVGRSSDELPSALELAEAVLAGRAVASSGPLIDLSADGERVRIGDEVEVDATRMLELRIAVWAPAWMGLARVHLVQSGTRIETWDAGSDPPLRAPAADAPGLWFEHVFAVSCATAGWYAVEVEGDADLAPVYPGVRAWAHSGPIFVGTHSEGE